MGDVAGDLVVLASETERLIATASQLPPESLGYPSLCQGWTRGHILTHLARNADAMGNLVTWARTGERVDMYPSADARNEAIETGSTRPHAEQYADVVAASHRLSEAFADLKTKHWKAKLELRGGVKTRTHELPYRRAREVVYHHVDLQAGVGFEDVDPTLVERFLSGELADLAAAPARPPLRLGATDGRSWLLSAGPEATTHDLTHVVGTPAGLLLWLARGRTGGVYTDSHLPALPKAG